jgi:hypothetical protein
MTGLQKVFFGIGVLAIIGLGVLVYRQMIPAPVVVPAPMTNTLQQEGRSDMTNTTPVAMPETPATPDAVADDILRDAASTDDEALNDEAQGETSQIEESGNAVSDLGTVYDQNQ